MISVFVFIDSFQYAVRDASFDKHTETWRGEALLLKKPVSINPRVVRFIVEFKNEAEYADFQRGGMNFGGKKGSGLVM
jgi:hypothetical protein